LAKYAMWASIEVVGDRPVGWRLPSALVGAAGVAGAYVLGRRLFDDPVAGVAGAAALMLDNLYYVHTNLAMLEVYPASLTVWAFALAFGPDNQARASGLVYGAAVACKYNAWFLAPVFFLVHWLRTPYANPYRRSAAAALWSLAVPVAVLVFTYLPYLVVWTRQFGPTQAVVQWFLVQLAAVSWDFGADATHAYASGPLTWVPMIRPVHYYAFTPGPDATAHIYSMGNPVTWWPAAALAIATLAIPVLWLRRQGRVLATSWFWLHAHHARVSWDGRARFLMAGLLCWAAWAPYLLLQRLQFLYYMTSVVPFLAVLLGGAAAVAWRRGGRWRWGVWAYGGVALAAFVFYFPLSEGLLVPRGWFDAAFASIPWMRR
jgi:predicted membrane-bound dolichyl-phosphate-mannose-protein mannosyltransferase